MTLDQRRHRLVLGISICGVAIVAFSLAALFGVERHITLFSSMPLWPAVGIMAGQWSSIRAKIAVHGPDALEEDKPASRTAVVAALVVLVVLLAIGGILALQVAR